MNERFTKNQIKICNLYTKQGIDRVLKNNRIFKNSKSSTTQYL